MTDLGFFSPASTDKDRAAVEQKLRDALDNGVPCSLINLENQLITGYDATGFDTAQPWPKNIKYPPRDSASAVGKNSATNTTSLSTPSKKQNPRKLKKR